MTIPQPSPQGDEGASPAPAEQYSLDLAGENLETRLNAQYQRNMEADAHNWTPEAMAMNWVLRSARLGPIAIWEVWHSIPAYQRDIYIRAHNAIQEVFDRQCSEPGIAELRRFGGLVEVFVPHQSWPVSKLPRKPTFAEEFPRVDQAEIDRHNLRAKALADRLSADWAAGRPASEYTFDPMLASTVSLLLGRKVEAVMPEEIEDRGGIPVSWILLWALQKDPKTINHRKKESLNPQPSDA